ncbi:MULTISPECIES: hypothetical protein [unclassified Streptomyces]|uniref:hypothetical protein n=1 Tax=Streptomyces sp. NBC_00667 TaxID=2975803 RepID=UPI002E30837A|nr:MULTISPECIES: hypothetical protein [unclassified Streptomyces]
MNGTRTTPPRPVDVAAVFPALAPLARQAVRLHPRPGSPTVHDSSIGGPLLWPAQEPWLYCRIEHEGLHPLVPVAQLYARDIPLLRPPGRSDLLQVLWCPSEHAPDSSIPIALSWRTAADVTDVLAAPPEPFDADEYLYVPEPCVLAPEQVTEYPDSLELPEELKQQITDPAAWRAAGIVVDDADSRELYDNALSHAPGWKIGGWASWGLTDPVPRFCVACGTAMTPLLTIASSEWHPTARVGSLTRTGSPAHPTTVGPIRPGSRCWTPITSSCTPARRAEATRTPTWSSEGLRRARNRVTGVPAPQQRRPYGMTEGSGLSLGRIRPGWFCNGRRAWPPRRSA